MDFERDTDEKPSFSHSKIYLVIFTACVIIMFVFPYYSGIFYPNTEKQTIKFKINRMTCTSYEERVNHEVNKLNSIETQKLLTKIKAQSLNLTKPRLMQRKLRKHLTQQAIK